MSTLYSLYEELRSLCHVHNVVLIQKKLWWQHVWPFLQQEMKGSEVLAAVLQPALAMVQESTANEYEEFILPTFRYVFNGLPRGFVDDFD